MTERAAEAASMMSGMVYATLRTDILQGALSPAEKLKIDVLSRRYGVTGTPVREALNQLASEGFVLRRDQRGFFVADVSREELMQLTNTRCWVALREAISHRDTVWEERLVLATHRLSRVDRSIDAEHFVSNPEWERAHRAFHAALIAACPSSWLIDFCMLLSDHAVRYRNLSMATAYRTRDVSGEHRQLAEASIGGSTEEAARLLLEHYRRTADFIGAAL
jgi:DNA-binding GntR family transcriptional regulator